MHLKTEDSLQKKGHAGQETYLYSKKHPHPVYQFYKGWSVKRTPTLLQTDPISVHIVKKSCFLSCKLLRGFLLLDDDDAESTVATAGFPYVFLMMCF